MNSQEFKRAEARHGIKPGSEAYEIDLACAEVYEQATRLGVRIDTPGLTTHLDSLTQRTTALAAKISRATDGSVTKPSSSRQTAKWLTAHGVNPADATGRIQDLAWLTTERPDLAATLNTIIRYRKGQRELSYGRSLLVATKDGRLHPIYDLHSCPTGRIYCTTLQVTPWPIRHFVLPEPGHEIVHLDFAAQEFRIMLIFTGETELLAHLDAGNDVHQITAGWIFDLDIADVSAHQRSASKAVTYGDIYGQTDTGLAKRLHIPLAKARHLKRLCHDRTPKRAAWSDQLVREAKARGYITTVLGRRRRIAPNRHQPGTHNWKFREEEVARIIVNTRIQGSAADCLRKAVASTAGWTAINHGRLLTTVHDSMAFSLPKGIDLTSIRAAASNTPVGHIPLTVGRGENWKAAHDQTEKDQGDKP